MKERREKRKRWVRRGRYAVEVEVDVVYPAGDPSEPCLEPDTVRWLDEVARRAEKGNSPISSPLARSFGQFLHEQNDSHIGRRRRPAGFRGQDSEDSGETIHQGPSMRARRSALGSSFWMVRIHLGALIRLTVLT
jgi:hypothetical protein